MIPILYRSDETAFTSNGLGRLADCISCTVTEERNGIYECQFEYPITGEMYDQIQVGCIIGAIHDDQHDIQPFDIYARTEPLDGVVTFYAHHISYRLGSIILKPMTGSSCAQTFAAIPVNTYNYCPFSFWTDKSVSATFKNKVPSAVKAILGGQEGSILDVYGKGEYKWDKWTVRLYVNRGNDNGVSIRYGVNLTELTRQLDTSDNYNAVAPYWCSSDGDTIVTLPEGYIIANNLPTSLIPWTASGQDMEDGSGNVIYFKSPARIAPVPMDLSQAFDAQPTVAQLRTEAQSRLDNTEAWLPDENITVSFVDLAHTEEYKNVSALQRVSLCDKVSVYCAPLGISAVKMQVIRVVFNTLTEMYDEIELGKAKTSFAQTLMAEVSEITSDLPSTGEVKSMLQTAIDNATDQITGAQDSHVKFVYDANGGLQEILIMDTEDINTAVKVWRWNSGGLGFSSNGYGGPYGTAITQDGQIVADFITTGYLLANIIHGGTLTLGGNNNVDGVLQVLNASGSVIGTWTKDGISISKGSIQGPSIIVGGSNNANGTITVRDASDVTIGAWNKDGITLNKGSININNGAFNVTNSGALTALNASLKGALHSTGSDISGNTVNTRIADGKIRIFGDTDDGDVQSWQPHTYLYLRALGGSTPEADIEANAPSFDIACDGLLQEHSGTLNLRAADGDYYHQSERGKVVIKAADVTINDYRRTQPLVVISGSHRYVPANEYINLNTTVTVNGHFEVSAGYVKSKVITTDQYSDRRLYCYETASPMFGDVGEGVIGDDGLCYIPLDAVFAQTITTEQYQVFLQRYGDGDCWVQERKGGYFVVQGTPGLAFGWEIKSKQADVDQLRLDRADKPFTVPEQSYGAAAAQYIDEIWKERISA